MIWRQGRNIMARRHKYGVNTICYAGNSTSSLEIPAYDVYGEEL